MFSDMSTGSGVRVASAPESSAILGFQLCIMELIEFVNI